MEKQERIDELSRVLENNRQMGGAERVARQHQSGRLTARERLAALFDSGTFEETGLLMQGLAPDSEGRITHINEVSGFGNIHGRTAIAHADDATVLTTGIRPGVQQPSILPVRPLL